jgi:GxxExxY protein
MCIECGLKSLPYRKEVDLPIRYKDKLLATSYRADFVCFNDVLVEIKALSQLTTKEEAQIINYLKTTGLRTGLLLNFGSRSLEFKGFSLTGGSVLPVSDPD